VLGADLEANWKERDGRGSVWSVRSVWSIWSVSCIWLNQPNSMNQIDQIDQSNQSAIRLRPSTAGVRLRVVLLRYAVRAR
jgi:hypothetical protein